MSHTTPSEEQHNDRDGVERLREAARERWGDQWTIEQRIWSDGDSRAYAFRSHGRVTDDGPIRRERMMIAPDDEVIVEEVLVEPATIESRGRID